MRRTLSSLALAVILSGVAGAAEIQGVIADWKCVQRMVQDGREKTLLHHRWCALTKNYKRDAYGLITDDKKYYRLDDPGNEHVKQLLSNTPDKDNLKVLVRGDLQGGTIKVTNMTIL